MAIKSSDLPENVRRRIDEQDKRKRDTREYLHARPSREKGKILIVLPLPARELSPNARVHWRDKANAVKKARETACTACLELFGQLGMKPPRWTAATEQSVFYRSTLGRMDADNALCSEKAYFDGLVDAGLLDDDAGLTHLPVRIMKDKDHPRLEIEVQG